MVVVRQEQHRVGQSCVVFKLPGFATPASRGACVRRSEQNQAIPRNLTRKLDGLFARWWLSFCSAEAVSPLRSATHPATKVRASRPLRPCSAPSCGTTPRWQWWLTVDSRKVWRRRAPACRHLFRRWAGTQTLPPQYAEPQATRHNPAFTGPTADEDTFQGNAGFTFGGAHDDIDVDVDIATGQRAAAKQPPNGRSP